MAEVVSTINKTGEDYNTLTLWEDDKDGDLVTAQTIQIAECYDDDGVLDDSFSIDGSTTNSSYYMKVTSPEGERHDGTADSGFTLRKIWSSGEDWSQAIGVFDDYSVIEWLIIKIGCDVYQNYQENCGIKTSTNDGIVIRNNIVLLDSFNGSSSSPRWCGIEVYLNSRSYVTRTQYVYNNIVYGFNELSDWRGIYAQGWNYYSDERNYFKIYNNTCYNNSIGIKISASSTSGQMHVWINNNICAGNTTDFSFSSNSNITYESNDYNLSSDTTATGTNSLTNKSASNQFVDTTSGSEDLHLKSTADALGAGTNLGSSYAIDIDGETRPVDDSSAPWDIGADQYIVTNTSTINWSGQDYDTVTLWEDDKDGDLQSDHRAEIALVHSDDGDVNDTFSISGSTTDDVYHMTLKADPDDKHTGKPFDSSGDYTGAAITQSATFDYVAKISDPYVVIKDLIIDQDLYAYYGCLQINDDTDGFVLDGCILYQSENWGGEPQKAIIQAVVYSNVTLTFSNNFFITRTDGIKTNAGSARTYRVYNNTFYRRGSSGGFGINPDQSHATYDIRNNIFYGFSNCINGSYADTEDYNITSDSSGSGSHDLTNKTLSDLDFTSTTDGAEDLHIASTSVAKNAGTDLSSVIPYTEDIDGEDRTGTWDIGADEYVSTATNATVTPSALSLTSSLKTSTNLGVSKPSALNVSGQVLSPSIVVTEPVSALSISSNLVSPSLLVDSTVSVSVLDLSLQQTSVSLSETFIASVLSLSSQINTPTLSSEISSSGESLILSLLSPTVSVSPTVSPSVLSLTGSVLSPTFETSIGVSALSETLSVSSVTLQAGCTLTATVLSLASSLLASQTALTYTDTVKALSSAIATPSYSNILLADSSQINATLLSPDRILTEIVSEETLTLALNTPTVLVSTNIIVSALTLTESLGSSQLEILIQPSALADTLSVQSSSVLIDALVSVSALNLTTSLISSQNAVSYIDTTKSIASSVISPDLGSTLIQTKESLVASLLAPTKIDTEIISSETLTLAIKTPSLIISSNVPVSALGLSATTISPSFKTVIPVASLSESLALLSSSVSADTSILLSALTLTSDLNSVQIVEKILSDTLSAILSVSSTEEILTFIDSGNNLTSTLNPVSLVSGEGIQVAVSAIDATLALLSSIISISSTVSVSVLNSSLTVLDPVISLPAIVETSILNVEVSVIEPTIKIDSSVIVPPVSFSGTVNSAVEESKTVLNVLNLTDSVVNPDIAISEFVLLSKLSLSLSVKTPKVSGELEQEPPRAADTSKRRRPFVRDVKYEFNVDGIKLFIFEKKYLIKGIRNNIRRFIFRTRGQKEFKFNFVLANLGKIRTEVAVDLELRGNKRVLIAKNLDVFGAKTNVLYFGYLGICGQKYANINYEYDTAGIKQTEYSCEEQLLFCGTVRKMSANIYPVVGRRDINKILEALSLDNF